MFVTSGVVGPPRKAGSWEQRESVTGFFGPRRCGSACLTCERSRRDNVFFLPPLHRHRHSFGKSILYTRFPK